MCVCVCVCVCVCARTDAESDENSGREPGDTPRTHLLVLQRAGQRDVAVDRDPHLQEPSALVVRVDDCL